MREPLSPQPKPASLPRPRVALRGVEFDAYTCADVVARVVTDLAAGRGGRVLTPNVDILRQTRRYAEARTHIDESTLVVADGAPLVWASRLAGSPLPERVAGSDLIWTLSEALAGAGRSIYLVGGQPGSAERAASVLAGRYPGLVVAGHACPPYGFEATPDGYGRISAQVAPAAPDLVYVGLGFPRQERVIAQLRPLLPRTWFLGCGAAIDFVAGARRRAPHWMRRAGLEWLHRLGREPGRLARRYLIHDLPYAAALLAGSALSRRGRGSRGGRDG